MEYPFLINSIQESIPLLVERLRLEKVNVYRDVNHRTIFSIDNDITSNLVKSFQEIPILNTKITVKGGALPSFWEVWETSSKLRKLVLQSADPHEEVWTQSKFFGYRIPTTFMPSYAKAVYDHFLTGNGKAVVLDPCAGWGDRFAGANASDHVSKYIGFDPNRTLRKGYERIGASFNNYVETETDDMLLFNDGSVIYSEPFEIGATKIPSNSIPFVFTSPPFFDYEIYNVSNPTYSDWIEEFYIPFFKEAARICQVGGLLAIYLGDTSSGRINQFIENKLEQIIPCLKLQKEKVGFMGIMSKKVRNIWMLQKYK
jgi:hypothetical protein